MTTIEVVLLIAAMALVAALVQRIGVRPAARAGGAERGDAAVAGSARHAARYDYRLEVSRFEEGWGYTLVRMADGQRLKWERVTLDEESVEAIGIVGEKFHAEDLQDAGFLPGCPLELVPEPTNPYDPNAVGVWNNARTAQAGYIPRARAASLAAQLRDGARPAVISMWENRVGPRRVSLRILLVWASDALELPPVPAGHVNAQAGAL